MCLRRECFPASSGLDVALINELTLLSGALRYCQAKWMSIFRAREEAQNQWKKQSPQAFEFHDALLLDLAVLGEKYPEPLTAIYFDLKKLA
ncbi:hypothetical protein [Maribellus maritimus]|uniref:hypothetical protein n=1 Tax=Maribellus maritimus TaxID=2870838 RepID=UPI001EEC026E|nr:hypothetical protein [Maribellus maritimus]MCG6190658.1 hypothetical protein [Maribellus maritimus]